MIFGVIAFSWFLRLIPFTMWLGNRKQIAKINAGYPPSMVEEE